jgi:putative endonuclease
VAIKKKKIWSVYMVRCKDGSLYTGISNDVPNRIKSHNSGRGAKYITAAKRPVKLEYLEEGFTYSGALKREYAVKHSGKAEKEALVKNKKKKEKQNER